MGKNIGEVLSILVKAIENNGEGKIADPLHFKTEEAGLAHCQKLATLNSHGHPYPRKVPRAGSRHAPPA